VTGLELLPKAKATRPDLPVIMITAYSDKDTKRTALERGPRTSSLSIAPPRVPGSGGAALPKSEVVGLGCGVAHDFPAQGMTHPPELFGFAVF